MNIDGSAFGKRIASSGSGGGGASNSYDAQIQRLQKQRERYVEKLQSVSENASDPEQAERLAQMYQTAITNIDSRIGQLQQAKTEEAQRNAEKQQETTEPAREADQSAATGETAKTKEAEKPEAAQKPEESRGGNDPLALQEDEELFWIDGGDRFWLGKKREPKYPSVLVDMSV